MLEKANEYQTDLLAEIMSFKKHRNQAVKEKNEKKKLFFQNLYNFFEGREKILDAFESKIFSIKSKGSGILNPNHSKLKILTPKQMLQRLPIALAQVKPVIIQKVC